MEQHGRKHRVAEGAVARRTLSQPRLHDRTHEAGQYSTWLSCKAHADAGNPESENGGERGIRTPGTVNRTTDFESAAIYHSASPPRCRERRLLSGPSDFLLSADVGTQRRGDRHRPV